MKYQSFIGLSLLSSLLLGLTVADEAIAVIKSNTVNGVVAFSEQDNGLVTVKVNVSGLTPAGEHGFHVHQYGDLHDGCMSAGSHFNPSNFTHGSPSDATRHVGDLGNVVADQEGNVVTELTDRQIQLSGQHSVLGRAVVFHALRDDLGKGTGDKAVESKKTGNAGGRLACAVIGFANKPAY